LRAPEDFEGLRSRKEKMTKTPTFFGKKKTEEKFYMRKTNGIFLVK
jgi:hypothetical protein